MNPRETRLRHRIDQLTDQRDQARQDNARLHTLLRRWRDHYPDDTTPGLYPRRRATERERAAAAVRYATEEERVEARRRTWRESKRRAHQHQNGTAAA